MSPTVWRFDAPLALILAWCQNYIPEKGRNPTLGDTKRLNDLHAPAREKAAPAGELRRRHSSDPSFSAWFVFARCGDAALKRKIPCLFRSVKSPSGC